VFVDTQVHPVGLQTPVVELREPQVTRRDVHLTAAGALLSITGIGMILAIITNEALYPAARHYSTFANSISDLSGTEPPNSYMVQPNRLMFIVTMAVAGILVLTATYLLWQVIRRRRVLIGLSIFGVGLLGIAVFPGNVATWHPLFAYACFIGGSITAILSRKILAAPARYIAATLGSIALAATVFGLESLADWGPQAEIGIGGIERWIAYPVLLWLVVLGSAFMTTGARNIARS
jgi:hypothetical membrane protein